MKKILILTFSFLAFSCANESNEGFTIPVLQTYDWDAMTAFRHSKGFEVDEWIVLSEGQLSAISLENSTARVFVQKDGLLIEFSQYFRAPISFQKIRETDYSGKFLVGNFLYLLSVNGEVKAYQGLWAIKEDLKKYVPNG